MSIYKRILAVQKAVDFIPKRGRNDFHKYSYATEADILSVKAVLNDNGLIVLPTMVSQETGFTPVIQHQNGSVSGGKGWAKVTISFRLVDVETGECLESQFTGYSEDANDKAIYKATTGANKYFYLKTLGLATEDDPENEKAAPNNSSQRGAYPPKVVGKPAAKPQAQEQKETVAKFEKNRALVAANKILALKKQYNLSDKEVLDIGCIESIKQLAAVGDYTALEQAAKFIQQRYRAAM